MPMLWSKKRRCGISWHIFASTTTDWALPSTLLWLVPLGRSQNWIWQNPLARVTGPSAHSIHCGRTHAMIHMIPVYFWCISTKFNYWCFLSLLCFHIELIHLLNISLLTISVVVSLFVIVSITSLNKTHNWLGSSRRGIILLVDYCVK